MLHHTVWEGRGTYELQNLRFCCDWCSTFSSSRVGRRELRTRYSVHSTVRASYRTCSPSYLYEYYSIYFRLIVERASWRWLLLLARYGPCVVPIDDRTGIHARARKGGIPFVVGLLFALCVVCCVTP